jgi:hypothetical protein
VVYRPLHSKVTQTTPFSIATLTKEWLGVAPYRSSSDAHSTRAHLHTNIYIKTYCRTTTLERPYVFSLTATCMDLPSGVTSTECWVTVNWRKATLNLDHADLPNRQYKDRSLRGPSASLTHHVIKKYGGNWCTAPRISHYREGSFQIRASNNLPLVKRLHGSQIRSLSSGEKISYPYLESKPEPSVIQPFALSPL